MGILVLVYHNPHITAGFFAPLYNLYPKQPGAHTFHCSIGVHHSQLLPRDVGDPKVCFEASNVSETGSGRKRPAVEAVKLIARGREPLFF